MKILVTGPRGFIASRLIENLKRTPGTEVVTLDRNFDPKTMPKFFKTQNFDSVVHLATLFLKAHTFDQIDGLCDSNLRLTTQLLDCAHQAKVKHFITFGTYYEFPKPASLYAATKAAMKPVLDFYATKGLRITELFLYDSYGPNDTRAKIVNFLIQAAKSGDPLPLSPGDQKMKLLHVQDVCSAILHTVKLATPANTSPEKGRNDVARFAIEPLESPTLKEIAAKVERATQSKLNAQWGAREYTPGVQMNPSLPYPALPDWKAQISLDQGLVEVIKTC